jgi:mono/diheme cytochrome c family protein
LRAARHILVALAICAVGLTGVVIALPWTHDLDNQISIKPQENPLPAPEFSVPITGREFRQPIEVEAKYANPVPADTASENRGSIHFATYCTPCHGPAGAGAGPVVKKGFLAPPNLTGSATRARTDGYMYSYIRHGGILMPSYGFALTQRDAWDVVNYLRKLQRENPAP